MPEKRRDRFGAILGILVFLGGVVMLLVTFKLAYNMFGVPPSDALGLKEQSTIDLAQAGESFVGLLVRVLLLVVMAIVSSLIANRGIALFGKCREPHHHKPSEPKS